MAIRNFVGGHNVVLFKGTTYDPASHKHKGGWPEMTFPYSGRSLSAKVTQTIAPPIYENGVKIPTLTPQTFIDVDPLPDDDNGKDLYIVSAMYVNACRALGIDTSRLLTVGGTVVDDNGKIIGVVGFNRN